jgi:hypothetical protein
MVSWPPVAADPEASVLRVAEKLGLDDPSGVRRLLAAWWSWAGSLTARGELADSDVFLAQREAEGLLELPLDVAARAIELDLADLHGVGAARRAARAGGTRPTAGQSDPGAPSPARAAAPSLVSAAPRPLAPQPMRAVPPSPKLVGSIAFGTLIVLVVGGVGLAQIVTHVSLPGGSARATTAPYRAWIGILAGAGGALLAGLVIWRRPDRSTALRLRRSGSRRSGCSRWGCSAVRAGSSSPPVSCSRSWASARGCARASAAWRERAAGPSSTAR